MAGSGVGQVARMRARARRLARIGSVLAVVAGALGALTARSAATGNAGYLHSGEGIEYVPMAAAGLCAVVCLGVAYGLVLANRTLDTASGSRDVLLAIGTVVTLGGFVLANNLFALRIHCPAELPACHEYHDGANP